jgi:hypothetical protein
MRTLKIGLHEILNTMYLSEIGEVKAGRICKTTQSVTTAATFFMQKVRFSF